MTDDTLVSVDTITIAALMRALQVVITAYKSEVADPAALAALQEHALAEIKALDTGEFTYEEQAEGLAEGLLLAKAIFRHAQCATPPATQPAPAQVAPGQQSRPELHPHRG